MIKSGLFRTSWWSLLCELSRLLGEVCKQILINETKNTLTFFPSELVALAPRHLAHTRKFLEEAAQH